MVVVTIHPEAGEPMRTRRHRSEGGAFSIIDIAPGVELYIYERAILDTFQTALEEVRAAMDDEEPATDNPRDRA
jgi:hypothetical protein